MRINIVNKQIKYALNLTSEELVHLMRLRPLQTRRTPFSIISPILIVCGEEKVEVEIKEVIETSTRRTLSASDDSGLAEYMDLDPMEGVDEEEEEESPTRKKRKRKVDPTEKIPGFALETELTPELFTALTKNKVVVVLLRIQNIPAYAMVENIRVNISNPGENGSLVMRIDRVQPIVDLLKTQLTESSFFETFIVGKSEEFFESTGVQLDDLVALVGIKRKENESDNELRMRVKGYLKIRIAETTDVDDEELKQLIRKAEEVQEIQRSMDESKNKSNAIHKMYFLDDGSCRKHGGSACGSCAQDEEQRRMKLKDKK